jgi:hypothetical protein
MNLRVLMSARFSVMMRSNAMARPIISTDQDGPHKPAFVALIEVPDERVDKTTIRCCFLRQHQEKAVSFMD